MPAVGFAGFQPNAFQQDAFQMVYYLAYLAYRARVTQDPYLAIVVADMYKASVTVTRADEQSFIVIPEGP